MNKKGFTLIELLIVIAIIGILSVALVPTGMSALKKARDGSRVSHLSTLNTALQQYVLDTGACPADTDQSIWKTALGPYIKSEFPKDPKNTGVYVYTYGVTASNKYCFVVATLENGNGNLAKGAVSCSSPEPTSANLDTLAVVASKECYAVYTVE